ncbi:MAG TPA: AGE family epimerase/isomerase [Bauldia sp.]|nr:AGE family epimerase/isomerase [Bauldia sp.]
MTSGSGPAAPRKWADLAYHRRWLLGQADGLFDFFERASLNPKGGFHALDDRGDPLPSPIREIHVTTRMVHCFAIARAMGRPGADRFIDHGMAYLWNGHRDRKNGGYFWAVGEDGPTDPRKQAYGHAFVLLAAASARMVGHPDADRLLADVGEVIRARFWEKKNGAMAEEFAADWQPISTYRGQNSNMHSTEALMAAFEATADRSWLDMAESIASLVIGKRAAENGWRVAEHFNENWELDRDYSNGDVFRPFGTTPGHSLEWTRLCLQLWELGGRKLAWLPDAAKALFGRATADGWDPDGGGFFYTLDWANKPRMRNHLWWPAAEGVGAAHFLNAIDGAPAYEEWYRRIWDFIAARLIDREHGAWRTELADAPKRLFEGKPDIYHALQACLIPLVPTSGSLLDGLTRTGLKGD